MTIKDKDTGGVQVDFEFNGNEGGEERPSWALGKAVVELLEAVVADADQLPPVVEDEPE